MSSLNSLKLTALLNARSNHHLEPGEEGGPPSTQSTEIKAKAWSGNSGKIENSPTVDDGSRARMWSMAFSNLNTKHLVSLISSELTKIPYSTKKQYGITSTDESERVAQFLKALADKLDYGFLHVDFANSSQRSIEEQDWSSLIAVHRSNGGTKGVYFLQSAYTSGVLKGKREIIVAKAITNDEFRRVDFFGRLAKEVFGIHCPDVRLIPHDDVEFHAIKEAVMKLYEQHIDLYESNGPESSKSLFSSSAIMLMELVQGKSLPGLQRPLMAADFTVLGQVFLLDLLLRNTDRLPSRKAMAPLGVVKIRDQGNPGNVMFGDEPGSLVAIDPDMNPLPQEKEYEYFVAVGSVIKEILRGDSLNHSYTLLEGLFFKPLPDLAGILDDSLEDLTPWPTSTLATEAIQTILNMMRIRVRAANNNNSITANYIADPPASNSEKDWREWVRLTLPRASKDVLTFIRGNTLVRGISTDTKLDVQEILAFERGVIWALKKAFSDVLDKQDLLVRLPAEEGHSPEMEFFLRILRYLKSEVGTILEGNDAAQLIPRRKSIF